MTNQLKSIAQTYMSMQEKVKYPHKMYDPKTGKEVEAKTPEDHDKYTKMGYTHDKPKMEAMDPVNKDAVKKKFDDRKDKDIDNDGDVDSSDKFLHKRRKAISKAMADSREFIYAAKMAKKNGEKTFTVGGKQYDVEEFDKVKVKESTVLKSYVEIMQEDKAKASHTASHTHSSYYTHTHSFTHSLKLLYTHSTSHTHPSYYTHTHSFSHSLNLLYTLT